MRLKYIFAIMALLLGYGMLYKHILADRIRVDYVKSCHEARWYERIEDEATLYHRYGYIAPYDIEWILVDPKLVHPKTEDARFTKELKILNHDHWAAYEQCDYDGRHIYFEALLSR